MAKASIKRLIENGVIDNLRKCAEVCAERGDYTGTIKTTKSLMKIAKKIDDEIVDIRTEYCKADTDGPPRPEEGGANETDTKSSPAGERRPVVAVDHNCRSFCRVNSYKRHD